MTSQQVADRIRQALPDARVEVHTEDDTHFSALLVAAAFAGLRLRERHQLVYGALAGLVGREIHALAIEAYTPEEWRARAR